MPVSADVRRERRAEKAAERAAEDAASGRTRRPRGRAPAGMEWDENAAEWKLSAAASTEELSACDEFDPSSSAAESVGERGATRLGREQPSAAARGIPLAGVRAAGDGSVGGVGI